MRVSANPDWRIFFGFVILVLLSVVRPGFSHANNFLDNPQEQVHTHDGFVGSEDPNFPIEVDDRSAPANKPVENTVVDDNAKAHANVSDTDLHEKLQAIAHKNGLTKGEFNRVARLIGLGGHNNVGGGLNVAGQLFSTKRFCGFSPRVDPSKLSNCAPGQFPWSVAILTSDKKFLCSGTLVSESIVVTTASCVLRYRSSSNQPLLVVLGAWSLPEGYEYMPELELFVSAAVINPGYNQQNINALGNTQNNIALLRLVENVDFDIYPHIFPICLIGSSLEQHAGISQCQVLGWPGLQEVQTWRTRAYLQFGGVQVIKQGCSSHPDSGACVQGQYCIGNEGSTIQCLTSSNRYYQWGMISSEPNCDNRGSVNSVAIVNLVAHYDFISQYLWTPNPNPQTSRDTLGPIVINNNNLNNGQANVIRVPAGGAAVVHGVNNPNIIRA